MTAGRSSPVTTRVAAPGALLVCSSCRTTIPSISTVGVPLRITTRITRVFGSKKPVGSSARLISDSLLSANVSWNPLACAAVTVTCALISASVTGCGTGTAMVGPIIRVKAKLAIGRHCDSLRQGDPEPSSRRLGELLRPHRAVGVGDPPELLGIAKVPGRDVVQPVALHDDMLEQRHEPVRLRNEPAAQVVDRPALAQVQLSDLDVRVAARQREHSASRNAVDAKQAQAGVHAEAGETLLLLLVQQEHIAASVRESQVIDGEHPHAETYSRPERVERGVEGLLGHGELGEPDRHDPAAA